MTELQGGVMWSDKRRFLTQNLKKVSKLKIPPRATDVSGRAGLKACSCILARAAASRRFWSVIVMGSGHSQLFIPGREW